MMINLKKDKFAAIDGAFKVLKETPDNTAALDVIKESLESCFPYKFKVYVVDTMALADRESFIMSVFPEISTIDRILRAVLEESKSAELKTLWEANKNWVIEIDRAILSDSYGLTDRELTAMILHEVGHVIVSGSIPSRIGLILQYEITKTSLTNKILLKEKIFRNLLSLPILDACVSDRKLNKSSLKEEVKADTFVAKMGYKKELESSLTKVQEILKKDRAFTLDNKMMKTADFSLQTLSDFQKRQDALAQKNLARVKSVVTSPFIKESIELIETQLFNGNTKNFLYEGANIDYIHELADDLIGDFYLTEFFQLNGKRLKRIDPSEIDYVGIKIQGMTSLDDKMMMISYIHSKLDIIEYYISILENPNLAKKYDVPHTLAQLYDMKKRLQLYRTEAINAKIPEKNKNLMIAWPSGYEG